MHELSLCQDLLEQVLALAEQHRARAVKRVSVSIGVLSGVEPELLATAFQELQTGTLAESAVLSMATLPVKVWCHACQQSQPTPSNDLRCPKCRGTDTRLEQGDELLLAQVELIAGSLSANSDPE